MVTLLDVCFELIWKKVSKNGEIKFFRGNIMRSALKENFENYLLNIRLQLFFKKFLMQKVVVIRVMV